MCPTSRGSAYLGLLNEVHCGNHSGEQSLRHKALTQGYSWPTMQKNATEYALKCVSKIC